MDKIYKGIGLCLVLVFLTSVQATKPFSSTDFDVYVDNEYRVGDTAIITAKLYASGDSYFDANELDLYQIAR